MTDELKPVRCGCGGEANIYTYEARWKITEDGYQRSVGCLKCGITTQLYDTESEAITAWNRAMRRAKVDILQNTSEDKGEMPYCPHCGDELEWE